MGLELGWIWIFAWFCIPRLALVVNSNILFSSMALLFVKSNPNVAVSSPCAEIKHWEKVLVKRA